MGNRCPTHLKSILTNTSIGLNVSTNTNQSNSMRSAIDAIVIVCMFIALYINLTDFPKQRQIVYGTLIKIEKN